MDAAVREVLERRLAAQRLTGPPAAGVAEAVRGSLAVQSQDAPLAQFSLGLRTGLDTGAVVAALDGADVVRTHVLRPTWHYVHRDDIGWLLDLTGPKIISGMAARHRLLQIDDAVREDSRAALRQVLAGRELTRPELQDVLPVTGYDRRGDVVGHLLLLAEAEGVICSGRPRDGVHTYALLERGSSDHRPPDPADELVRRFVVGHGPTSVRDLQRWCNLTLTQIRHGLAAGDFRRGEVQGVELWWADGATHGLGSWLLPTFDEAFLSHDAPRFPRLDGHPMGEQHFNPAAAGGGFVIVDGVDVGTFKRVVKRGGAEIALTLAPEVGSTVRSKARVAAERFASYLGIPTRIRVV